jgi:hypothetical protein
MACRFRGFLLIWVLGGLVWSGAISGLIRPLKDLYELQSNYANPLCLVGGYFVPPTHDV